MEMRRNPLVIPAREDRGILAAPIRGDAIQNMVRQEAPVPPNTQVQFQYPPPTPVSTEIGEGNKGAADTGKGTWLPKMDFPKFDGADVRIWIDKCHTFFAIYKIPEGFKVAAATMYMSDRAAHWYQSYKMTNIWHNWEQFREAVITEFEGNSRRDKMRDLLLLRQTNSVEEYKKKFDTLVYQIKLYDHSIGELMLVTRFVLGLKEELRAAVEI